MTNYFIMSSSNKDLIFDCLKSIFLTLFSLFPAKTYFSVFSVLKLKIGHSGLKATNNCIISDCIFLAITQKRKVRKAPRQKKLLVID